jgi:type I site-specific restriction endonuclease
MKPEEKARHKIDQLLEAAGWTIHTPYRKRQCDEVDKKIHLAGKDRRV